MSEPNAMYNPINHYGLPSKVAQEAYGLFMKFDRNRNGSITLDEIQECVRLAKVQFEDTDMDKMLLKYMDLNEDGTVSLDEFMKFMAAVHRNECQEFKPFVTDVKK
ncbi:unnamed protein product [Rotaria sp. Silwood1]|nr:unnamed protein product [Rotaria sp. Silwood1]CAF1508808.1 unnamed protein product [Rotaria sp. Silwood1]CAF1511670.1 unnamed protein product [Rotaria sp. Silwood1]CAF3656054.1 unnamed protein product [Rotaria sp. Silwood1]CAF3662508.1 unnamed protein product [Rotaria sp. Silwood1]